MILGFHTSVSKGLAKGVETVSSLSCNALQIFAGNPRSYSLKHKPEKDVSEFIEALDKYEIKYAAVHSSYLINLASDDEDVRDKSIRLLRDELTESSRLRADAYVIHPGKHKSGTKRQGMDLIIGGFKTVLDSLDIDHPVNLLLENTAGAGSELGSLMSELAELLEGISYPHKGICLDTCHAFGAGYDVSTEDGIDRIFSELGGKKADGLIKMIHLNDGVKLGEHVDRHKDIGKGDIGLNGFKIVINHDKLRNLPMVLETPKKDIKDDERNVNQVRELRAEV